MDGLMDLLGAGASIAGGGVFGAIGSVVGSVFKSKAAAKERADERSRLQIEHSQRIELAQLEASLESDAQVEAMARIRLEGSQAGLVTSLASDNGQNLSRWAANVKGLYRPFLTTALVGLCLVMFFYLLDALQGGGPLADLFDLGELVAMVRYIVYSIVFSTSTAIVWWFGERALTPPSAK